MTAGAGLVHSEEPLAAMLRDGGRMHGLQLWVNLPRAEKMTPSRYQLLSSDAITKWSDDGGKVVVRLIAGETIHDGQMAVLGAGDRVVVEAASELDVMLLGGRPIREPIVWYGPFVMNAKQEIIEALDDYEAGRLGRIAPQST